MIELEKLVKALENSSRCLYDACSYCRLCQYEGSFAASHSPDCPYVKAKIALKHNDVFDLFESPEGSGVSSLSFDRDVGEGQE